MHGAAWSGLEEQGRLRGAQSPRRQLGERQRGDRQDVAAGPLGRAHVACRGSRRTRRGVARQARLEEQGRLRGIRSQERQLGERRHGERRDVAASPRGRARVEEVTEHGEAWPCGPDLKSRTAPGTQSPRRQFGERQREERRDDAARPQGRAHVACRGVTVHGEAWPDRRDVAASQRVRAYVANLREESAERTSISIKPWRNS